MITIPELTAQALGSFLASETRGRFGSSNADLSELLPYAARLALDCIGNSDALYHNVEHSMLVTLAGHDILIGRMLLRPTTAGDYANFILACLVDDVGHLRERARPMLAMYFGGMGARGKNFYNDVLKRYGFEREAGQIQDAYL